MEFFKNQSYKIESVTTTLTAAVTAITGAVTVAAIILGAASHLAVIPCALVLVACTLKSGFTYIKFNEAPPF